MRRSLWIINHYAEGPGSTGSTRHYDLAVELAKLGWDTTIFASSFAHWAKKDVHEPRAGVSRQEVLSGVRFVWMRTPPYVSNGLKRLLNISTFTIRVLTTYRNVRGNPPDIVVGSSFHPFAALAAYWIASYFKCPFVFEVRDLWPKTMIDVMGASANNPVVRFLGFLERFLSAKATCIISLLKDASAHFDSIGGYGQKVVWIPNGVNLDRHNHPAQISGELAALLGDLSGRFIVCYTGSHGAANSLGTLVDAATALAGSGVRSVHFVLVGDGPEKGRLVELCKSRKLDNISFVGPIPKETIPDFLTRCHAATLCMPPADLYRYGISMNKLTDYLAASLPVAMTGTGSGNPVQESGSGSVLSAGDSDGLARVLHAWSNDRVGCATLGRKGREYVVQEFSTATLAKALAGVLDHELSCNPHS